MTPAVAALALLLLATTGQSGNEGSIEGTVIDGLESAVPGAVVKATNLDTGLVFSAFTDGRGRFVFLVLQAGRYEIVAECGGFARFVQRDVLLAVGGKLSLAIQLGIGGHDEKVTVEAPTPLVEIRRTSFASRIDARAIAELPLNGRNFLNLALLTPGTSPAGGRSGGFFSVGAQSSMNSLLVDGADQNGFNAEPAGGAQQNRYLFSQEAIQEFEVETNSYSAEFGRAGTAVVNVITKSGSNQPHGSGFWYYRDSALAATGCIEKLNGESKQPFQAHQFGGTAGGPVVRDRLFFYGSYDGQRRSEPNLTLLNLPSTFKRSEDATIAGYQDRALTYLRERAGAYVRDFEQNVLFAKFTGRLGAAHWLNVQWNRHRLTAANFASGGPQHSREHNGTDGQVVDSYTGSVTSTLSPRAVNVARASFLSSYLPQHGNSTKPEAVVVQDGQIVLQVGSLQSVQQNGAGHAELADTLSVVRGRHTQKLGGTVLVERGRFFSTVNFYGAYQFNTLETFGQSLAGVPRTQGSERYVQAFSGQGSPPIDVRPNYVELAVFAQDSWQARPSLTVDLGLRYDVQVMAPSKVRNTSAALLMAGVDTSFVPTDADNFAPRAGVAWTPDRKRRLVVRGGYGVFFPRVLGATVARAFAQNGITAQTRTFTPSDMPVYPNTKCGAWPAPGGLPNCPVPATGRDLIMAIDRRYEQPMIRQGSVGAEYAWGANVSVSATFLRVKGLHLLHWQDINLGDASVEKIGVAGTSEIRTYRRYRDSRPMRDFDRVLLLKTTGSSSYRALALQVTKRWSRGFQLGIAYTRAAADDDNPTLGTVNPGPGDPDFLSDALQPALDRGAADYLRRHRFVLHGVWDLDYARGLALPARVLLGGWKLSAIVTASSGTPYSPLLNYDLNNDGNGKTDRPPGLPRNAFFLPASVSVDPRLTRTIPLKRHATLELSVDAFNVFNRGNISAVNTGLYAVSKNTEECGFAGTPCLAPKDDSFGRPKMAFDPRVVQVSMKIGF